MNDRLLLLRKLFKYENKKLLTIDPIKLQIYENKLSYYGNEYLTMIGGATPITVQTVTFSASLEKAINAYNEKYLKSIDEFKQYLTSNNAIDTLKKLIVKYLNEGIKGMMEMLLEPLSITDKAQIATRNGSAQTEFINGLIQKKAAAKIKLKLLKLFLTSVTAHGNDVTIVYSTDFTTQLEKAKDKTKLQEARNQAIKRLTKLYSMATAYKPEYESSGDFSLAYAQIRSIYDAAGTKKENMPPKKLQN